MEYSYPSGLIQPAFSAPRKISRVSATPSARGMKVNGPMAATRVRLSTSSGKGSGMSSKVIRPRVDGSACSMAAITWVVLTDSPPMLKTPAPVKSARADWMKALAVSSPYWKQ